MLCNLIFFCVARQVFAELTTSNDAKQVEEVIAEYNRDVSDLWDKLMALELQLVDQLDETIKGKVTDGSLRRNAMRKRTD